MSPYVTTLQQATSRRSQLIAPAAARNDDRSIRIKPPSHLGEPDQDSHMHDWQQKVATRHSVIVQTLAISRNTFPRLWFGRQSPGVTAELRNLPPVASSLVAGVATMVDVLLRQKDHS